MGVAFPTGTLSNPSTSTPSSVPSPAPSPTRRNTFTPSLRRLPADLKSSGLTRSSHFQGTDLSRLRRYQGTRRSPFWTRLQPNAYSLALPILCVKRTSQTSQLQAVFCAKGETMVVFSLLNNITKHPMKQTYFYTIHRYDLQI